jgi:hypothetical protein
MAASRARNDSISASVERLAVTGAGVIGMGKRKMENGKGESVRPAGVWVVILELLRCGGMLAGRPARISAA